MLLTRLYQFDHCDCISICATAGSTQNVRIENILQHLLPAAFQLRFSFFDDPFFQVFEPHFVRHDFGANPGIEAAVTLLYKLGEDLVLDNLMSDQEPACERVHTADM